LLQSRQEEHLALHRNDIPQVMASGALPGPMSLRAAQRRSNLHKTQPMHEQKLDCFSRAMKSIWRSIAMTSFRS